MRSLEGGSPTRLRRVMSTQCTTIGGRWDLLNKERKYTYQLGYVIFNVIFNVYLALALTCYVRLAEASSLIRYSYKLYS